MKCWGLTLKKWGKPTHRYLGQKVIQLKNLYTPKRIGAATKAIRRIR
jgi:hypothetical protein